MDIRNWIASVVGAALLTLLADAVMPEGESRGYVKNALSVIIVFLITFPLPSLFSGGITADFSFAFNEEKNYTDENLLNVWCEKRAETLGRSIEELCVKNGINGCSVSAEARFEQGVFIVEEISVTVKKSGIPENMTNIIVTERIKEIASAVAGVDKEAVKVDFIG